MGMNVNRGFFNLDPNWKDRAKEGAKSNPPEFVVQELKAEVLEPGNMDPLPRPSGKQPSLEEILKRLDYQSGFER